MTWQNDCGPIYYLSERAQEIKGKTRPPHYTTMGEKVRTPMNTIMPSMIECPFCSLPVPPYSTERPYCNRACFDGHISEALDAYFDNSKTRVVNRSVRQVVAINGSKHHKLDCSCYKC